MQQTIEWLKRNMIKNGNHFEKDKKVKRYIKQRNDIRDYFIKNCGIDIRKIDLDDKFIEKLIDGYRNVNFSKK